MESVYKMRRVVRKDARITSETVTGNPVLANVTAKVMAEPAVCAQALSSGEKELADDTGFLMLCRGRWACVRRHGLSDYNDFSLLGLGSKRKVLLHLVVHDSGQGSTQVVSVHGQGLPNLFVRLCWSQD